MQRILIIGTSGCGKTTLARKLASLINVPAHDLDDYYWLPNWQPNPTCLEQKLNQILNEPSWIISGNYSKFQPILWEKADTIIWLDYSFKRCFLQGLKRSVSRMVNKHPCCNGNYETFTRTFFSKQSLLIWILNTYNRRKKDYSQSFEKKASHKTYLKFSHPRELQEWLNIVV